MITLLLPMLAAAGSDLGKAGAQCSLADQVPALHVEVQGLKDRRGLLKLELYPPEDHYFLGDDGEIVRAGKPFRRVEVPVPQSGPVVLCIRAPGPGTYAISILHDRDSNHKFGLSVDGVGFANNPRLGMGKPHAATVSVRIGGGPVSTRIVMNYRRGLFSFGPLK